MRPIGIVVFLLLVTQITFAYPIIPDSDLTPGHLCTRNDRDFDGYRYAEKIAHCRRGVSGSQKRRIYESYSIPPQCRGQYTIDHLVPLSMGGSNRDLNLWPEHYKVKQTRRDLEQEVYLLLKKGEIKRETAVEIILEEKFNPPIPGPVHDPCLEWVRPRVPNV